MRIVAPLVLSVVLVNCNGMFFNPWKPQSREIAGAMRLDVPKRLENGRFSEDPAWVSVHFDKYHFWAMGNSTFYQTRLHLLVLAPDIDEVQRRAAFAEAPSGLDQCRDVRWRPEERGSAVEWRTGECLHAANMVENMSWIVQGYSPSKKIHVTLRVWKKELELEKAREVVLRAIGSFQALPGLAAVFERVRDEPRRAEEAFARRREALPQALESLGFPAPVPGQAQEHDGFFYLNSVGEEADFTIGRLLGSVVPRYPRAGANIPGNLAEGGMQLRYDVDLFWFVHQDGEWRQHSNHVNYYIPAPIAAQLGERHTDPRSAYFYAFYAVRLRDADEWEPGVLRRFIERAREAERQFARGEVVTPGQ
jgi:hypothetical protein